MIRYALREFRYRPRRLIATWLGIALAVAFLVATQTLARTELMAMGKDEQGEMMSSDVVVAVSPEASNAGVPDPKTITTALNSLSDASWEAVYSTYSVGGEGSNAINVTVTSVANNEALRAGKILDGRWPKLTSEFVASQQTADKLKIAVGEKADIAGNPMTLVGITDDPRNIMNARVRVIPDFFAEDPPSTWIVHLPDGMSATDAVQTINTEIDRLGGDEARAFVTDDYVTKSVENITSELNVMETIASAFGILSLVVGIIVISTTFAIIVAQRRRQIALIRMLGATTGQVRRGLLFEAFLIGVVGAALGVGLGFAASAGISTWTGAIGYGMEVNWTGVALSFGAGVLAAIVAAWVPMLRTSRIKPMEAIRQGATSQTKTMSVGRIIVCSLVVLVGIGLSVATFFAGDMAFYLALASGAILAIGILASSPLFVPPLLRLLGRVVRPLGPIVRLAANNSSRNAARSAATATALMLAVGLVVTLQVATATTKATAIDEIHKRTPLDVSVTSESTKLPESVVNTVKTLPGVEHSAAIRGATVTDSATHNSMLLLEHTPDTDAVVGDVTTPTAQRGVVGATGKHSPGSVVEMKLKSASGKTVTVSVQVVTYLSYGEIMVDSATFGVLAPNAPVRSVWASVPDKSNSAAVYTVLNDSLPRDAGLSVGGGLIMSAMITQIMDLLLMVATVLSAVAVIIALIGVGNTLGLSVMERTRESALLRALGLQRGGLRAALTFEALLIGIVGVATGVAAGLWFGWFAAASLTITSGWAMPTLSVDPWTTGGLVLIALAAAVLSSVAPGRRAAKATPVEALAEVD